MKALRFFWLFAIIGAVATVFVGCELIDYKYSLDQNIDNIEKVEIHLYDYKSDSSSFVTEMEPEAAKALLAEITSLTCHKSFGDPIEDYGFVVLYIRYSNGEAEVLGRLNSASVDSNGKYRKKDCYFNGVEWCSTVLKYVDPELVPELVEDLELCESVYR